MKRNALVMYDMSCFN